MDNKKIFLSNTDKKIFGVCGGIGEYFNIDSTLIRLAWVFLCIPTLFLGVIAYFIAAMIIPKQPWE